MKQHIPLSSQFALILIGSILLAIPLVLGFLLVNPDFNGEKNDQMEKELKAAKHAINGRRKAVEELAVKVKKAQQRALELEQVEANVQQLKQMSADLTQTKADIAETQKEFIDLANDFFECVENFRLAERTQAVGETIDELVTKTGETFTDFTIQEVDAESLTGRHSSGITRIPYDQLPITLQKRFEFADDKAVAFIEAELERQAKRN